MMHLTAYNGLSFLNHSDNSCQFNGNIPIISKQHVREPIQFMESAIYEEFIPDANYTITNARYSCSNNLSIIFKDATFQPPEMVISLNGFNLPPS